MSPHKGFFVILQETLRQTHQKFDFFSFQSKSFSPKIILIFLKTIFALKYLSKKNIFYQNLVPYFWWVHLKFFYNVPKNPLRVFIGVEKSIEFYLPHYEISQLSSRYHRLMSRKTTMKSSQGNQLLPYGPWKLDFSTSRWIHTFCKIEYGTFGKFAK